MLGVGLGLARIGAGIVGVVGAGVRVRVCSSRICVEDCIGSAPSPSGVSGGFQLLTCRLGLLALQLELHLKLLELGGRRARAQLASR